jgi:ABC-type transport system involved in multi-copper enzyme maturation permease subunit
MPVYQNRYKTWEGIPQPLFRRLLAFPRYSYMQLKGQKLVFKVLGLGWLPFILFMIYIYVRVNVKLLETLRMSPEQLPPVSAQFFFVFLIIQLPFLLFFTLVVGPPLISRDIRHKALPMILSKPISRWEYILGKYLVLFLILSIFTWFQGFILFVSQTAAVPKASEWRKYFWSENLWIMPKIFIFSVLCITTLNFLVMVFSSLTNNYRFATAAVIMFIIGGIIIGGISSEILHSNKWLMLSVTHSIISIGNWLFGLDLKTKVPPNYAWLMITILWLVSIGILSKRIKAFELYRE